MIMKQQYLEEENYELTLPDREDPSRLVHYHVKKRHSGLWLGVEILDCLSKVGSVQVSRMPDNLPGNLRGILPEEYHQCLYLYGLDVHPYYRRTGLGSRLLDEGKRFALKHRKPVLLIPDQESDIPFCDLMRFYERNGFHELEAHNGFLIWNGGNQNE